ncbi:MAG: rhodanese-like domain-containing protein [Psychromonas sp.]
MDTIFHQIKTQHGCQSYMIGCKETGAAIIIDPEISQMEHYQGLALQDGLTVHYLLDTHTHADHFSASQILRPKMSVPLIMHSSSATPFIDIRVDDGEMIIVGKIRLRIVYTPGHTSDSICIVMNDRIFTGDTLLIGGTGRTDLPSGNPEQLYDSLFNKLIKLDPQLLVYPAHIYSDRQYSTLAEEFASNPRLQKKQQVEFVKQMRELDLNMPVHLTEALRTNLCGGKTVSQLINEAAEKITFMAQDEILSRIQSTYCELLMIDLREKEAFDAAHIPGAVNIPRGQLELRVNDMLKDPSQRILVYCEFGKISILAAATLKEMGFSRTVAMDLGIGEWIEKGYPVVTVKDAK